MQDGRDARGGGGQVSAHPGIDHAADAGDAALPGGGHFDIFDMVATVGGGDKVLRPGFGPLDRPAQPHRAKGGNHFPGIDGDFAAEAAAHFRGDNPYLMLRDAGDQAGDEAGDVGVLGSVPDGQFPHRGQVAGNGGTGFHRVGDEFLLNDGVSDNYGVRVGKGGVGVAAGSDPMEGLIVGGVRVQLRRAGLQGRFRIDYCRQRFVVHRD